MKQHSKRPRIMVCEDEPLIAMDLVSIINESGCEAVGPFSSARAARAALRKQHVDAAVLDIDLADGASTPLAGELREAGVRIIVLSGLHTSSPPPEFAGVEWLSKPADEGRLRAFCAVTLAHSQLYARVRARAPEPASPPAV